ncbi:MAG: beta-galactosidase [bacterium]
MDFGCDYYPEHWPEERWEKDAQMMAEAGFCVVRLAEFAGGKLEPREGQFDFDWLNKAIQILAQNKIKTVLGTPTATPPAWLAAKHPDILRVNREGLRTSFGGRRAYCPNSRRYRSYSQKIVSKMAEHYKDKENVIGWQIDNEFGGDRGKGLCYCEECASNFRHWLKGKYKTLDKLNQEWGTVFWSQTYTEWEQVPLPRQLETAHNPSLLLDYRRFISDSYISYQKLQLDILRKICPHKFITHNFMGLFSGIDYYKLAQPLDFIAWDNYPSLRFTGENKSPVKVSLSHDVMRGLKEKNFWVMEQQSGPSGWQCVGRNHHPGEIRLWTYQAIAHGAEGILYFRWRTSRFGTEQLWRGILDQSGVPTKRYEEVKKIGQELKRIKDKLIGLEFPREVAMLASYDEQWAFEIQPNNPKFDYQEHFTSYYELLNIWNVPVDVISIQGNLSKYRLVLAPALFLINDELVDNLKEFVKKGGILIVTFRSGIKNWNNILLDEPLPAKLNDLLGIEVFEYDSPSSIQKCKLKLTYPEIEPLQGECDTWCDIIKCRGAEIMGVYTEFYYKGEACITINQFGQGRAIYIGTNPSPEIKKRVLRWAIEKSRVKSSFQVDPKDIEVILRRKENKDYLFFLNHSEKSHRVKLDRTYKELLGKRKYPEDSVMAIEPKGVRILCRT